MLSLRTHSPAGHTHICTSELLSEDTSFLCACENIPKGYIVLLGEFVDKTIIFLPSDAPLATVPLLPTSSRLYYNCVSKRDSKLNIQNAPNCGKLYSCVYHGKMEKHRNINSVLFWVVRWLWFSLHFSVFTALWQGMNCPSYGGLASKSWALLLFPPRISAFIGDDEYNIPHYHRSQLTLSHISSGWDM